MREQAVERKPGFRFGSSTFQALKFRNFRLLWAGQIGSGLSQQSEMLIRSWLILDLTGSGVMLGVVHLTRAVGSLLVMPVAGVMADRVDRRFLLIGANAVNAAFFALLALLVITGHVAVWHVVASAVVAGAAMTVQNASNQAIIPNLVPREGIMNALALNSVTQGADRVLGLSLAGYMIQFTGVQGAYLAMAALLVVPMALYGFLPPLKVAQTGSRESFVTSFMGGLTFAMKTPATRVVMLVGFTVVMFAMPFLQLMPLYVREVLKMGPGSLGLIVSLPGFLTIGGGLVAASLGDFKYKGRLLLLAVLSPATAAIILALTSTFGSALLAVCIFGALSSQYQPSSQGAAMKATPDHLRGRVASFMSMIQTTGSAGVLLYGLVADQFGGIQHAYLFFGILAATLQLSYFIGMRSFRQLS